MARDREKLEAIPAEFMPRAGLLKANQNRAAITMERTPARKRAKADAIKIEKAGGLNAELAMMLNAALKEN